MSGNRQYRVVLRAVSLSLMIVFVSIPAYLCWLSSTKAGPIGLFLSIPFSLLLLQFIIGSPMDEWVRHIPMLRGWKRLAALMAPFLSLPVLIVALLWFLRAK